MGMSYPLLSLMVGDAMEECARNGDIEGNYPAFIGLIWGRADRFPDRGRCGRI